MIVRYALFEGKIKDGMTEAFRKEIMEDLYPIWLEFPGALEVYCSFVDERDPGAIEIPLIQSVKYPDRQTLDAALESDVRARAKALTGEICAKYFEGTIHHHITEPTVWTK
ncbi:MAG: hypothetical protein AAF362_10350 [Pseudomonadota bacterium]